jgi:hypothetical protein
VTDTSVFATIQSARDAACVQEFSLRTGWRAGRGNFGALVCVPSAGRGTDGARREQQRIDALWRAWSRNSGDVEALRELHAAVGERLQELDSTGVSEPIGSHWLHQRGGSTFAASVGLGEVAVSILVRLLLDGLTRQQYAEVDRRMQETNSRRPQGLRLHVAFGSEDDLKVSEIWDSAEQMQAWGKEVMLPILEEVGVKVSGPPEVYEVHAILQPEAAI